MYDPPPKTGSTITTPPHSSRRGRRWRNSGLLNLSVRPAVRPHAAGRDDTPETKHSVLIRSKNCVCRKKTERPDKCLEATHLTTVRTVVAVLRGNPTVVEVQVVGIGAARRRRPAVPVLADVVQRTVGVAADARTRQRLKPVNRAISPCSPPGNEDPAASALAITIPSPPAGKRDSGWLNLSVHADARPPCTGRHDTPETAFCFFNTSNQRSAKKERDTPINAWRQRT